MATPELKVGQDQAEDNQPVQFVGVLTARQPPVVDLDEFFVDFVRVLVQELREALGQKEGLYFAVAGDGQHGLGDGGEVLTGPLAQLNGKRGYC